MSKGFTKTPQPETTTASHYQVEPSQGSITSTDVSTLSGSISFNANVSDILKQVTTPLPPFNTGPTNPSTVSTKTTLPTDSSERKDFPLFRGVLCYFPAALAGIAKVSKAGNDKHNYGQELHHDRKKSQDHADCILRHLMDTSDLLASLSRNESGATQEQVLIEVSQFAWRALAYSQELHEKFGSPLAPGAKK